MIRAKEGMMSEEHAASLGMLSPASGVAAMAAVLGDLVRCAAPRAAGGLGVATQTYWRLLLAQVKPLPRFFSQLDVAVEAAAKVCTVCTSAKMSQGLHAHVPATGRLARRRQFQPCTVIQQLGVAPSRDLLVPRRLRRRRGRPSSATSVAPHAPRSQQRRQA